MVEEIEKRRQRIVLGGPTFEHPLGVTVWKDSLSSGEAREGNGHACGGRGIGSPLDIVHGAWWECHRKARDEAGEFLMRLGRAAHRFSAGKDTGQQARGLEELELVTSFEQFVL
jgi:hypothetical protein